MTDSRYGHTATRLDDGTVLIAGGQGDGNGGLRSAEIYHPDTQTFTCVGGVNDSTGQCNDTMIESRASSAAELLSDGTVLIGGIDSSDGMSNTSEVYDPALGTFAPSASTAGTTVVEPSPLVAMPAVANFKTVKLGKRKFVTLHLKNGCHAKKGGKFGGGVKCPSITISNASVPVTESSDVRDSFKPPIYHLRSRYGAFVWKSMRSRSGFSANYPRISNRYSDRRGQRCQRAATDFNEGNRGLRQSQRRKSCRRASGRRPASPLRTTRRLIRIRFLMTHRCITASMRSSRPRIGESCSISIRLRRWKFRLQQSHLSGSTSIAVLVDDSNSGLDGIFGRHTRRNCGRDRGSQRQDDCQTAARRQHY